MRITFLLPGRGSSGGVRVTSIIANGLLDRRHEVRILFQHASPRYRASSLARLILDRFVSAPDWLGEFRGEVGHFRDVRDCRFREGEIVVGVGMSMSYQLGFLSAISNPKVQYVHGATPWDPDLMQQALSLPFPKILVASYLKQIVASAGGGKVLAVVHNGINPTEYFSSLPETERDGVGTIYSGHPAKDPETICEVLRRCSASRPDVPTRVFGGDRRPSRLPPCEYVRFPPLDRAREIYSRSLVWVLASGSEGFPAPVLEAMACGCAVVATDCGGPSDVIIDGVNGFLVPVGDTQAIVNRVEHLLEDHKTRQRIRVAALQTIAQFTWDKCVGDVEKAFGLVLK